MSFRPRHSLLVRWGMTLACVGALVSPAGAEPLPVDPSPEEVAASPALEPRPLRWGPGMLPRLEYPKEARRFDFVDALITGLFGVTAATSAIIGPNTEHPRVGGVWFDEAVRDALLPTEYGAQLAARDTSDVLLGASLSYAFFGDSVVNAAWLRSSEEVAIEVGLVNTEVVAITLGLQQLSTAIVSRERPYGRTCGTDFLEEDTFPCQGNDRYKSHFSGHASLTFAVAAATCVHHSRLRLAGDYGWVACLSGLLTASATASLRVIADQHYATDVLMGAAVGSAVGWLVPTLHYGFGAPTSAPGDIAVQVLPTPNGVFLSGVF